MHYVNYCISLILYILFAKIVFSGFRWHHMWRNVHIELSKDHLEASCYKKSSGNHWATFAGKKLVSFDFLYPRYCTTYI